jgi:hypothetical protein
MTVLMVGYEVPDEGVAPVTSAIKKAFAAVADQAPPDLKFTYYRRPGGNSFVGVVELPDDAENPLSSIDAARELQATMTNWALGETPVPQPLEVLGSYGYDGPR